LLIVLASLGAVLNIGKTIVGVGGLIFLHELGHFMVGRWCGVHAEAFSIGFGPVLFKWNGKPLDPKRPDQRTEYRLSAIPLGGYVKFLGEQQSAQPNVVSIAQAALEESRGDPGESDPRSFNAATYPRKVAIMLAGVTMNVIAAFALFAVTFGGGWETIPPVVGEVQSGTPAWEHGLKPGDEFVSINGARPLDFSDIMQETIVSDSVDVVVRRGDEELRRSIPTRDNGEGLRGIGVKPVMSSPARIAVEEDGAAAKAGFRTDDRIVSVDGKPSADFPEARRIHADAKKDTVWTVRRDDKIVELTLPWKQVPHPVIGIMMSADSGELVVARDGAAAAAGLRSGDRAVSVGGVAANSAQRFVDLLDASSATGDVVVLRGGAEIKIPLPGAEAGRALFASSVAAAPGSGPIHAWLQDGPGPAREAGLPDGCELVSVDDVKVESSTDVQAAVKAAFEAGHDVVIKWRDAAGAEGTSRAKPTDKPDADLGGMEPTFESRTFRADGPVETVVLAADRTQRWIVRIFRTVKSLFSGGVSAKKLAGPIGISRGAYHSAKSSWSELLMFLGMLSMNLAVLNVLPLPLLDGGQLAVHTIERVRGRPIPERVLEVVMWAGLILLLGFVVYVSKNDILSMMR
jgi:regulator of sigma E protease